MVWGMPGGAAISAAVMVALVAFGLLSDLGFRHSEPDR
jgi:hypothetical protein